MIYAVVFGIFTMHDIRKGQYTMASNNFELFTQKSFTTNINMYTAIVSHLIRLKHKAAQDYQTLTQMEETVENINGEVSSQSEIPYLEEKKRHLQSLIAKAPYAIDLEFAKLIELFLNQRFPQYSHKCSNVQTRHTSLFKDEIIKSKFHLDNLYTTRKAVSSFLDFYKNTYTFQLDDMNMDTLVEKSMINIWAQLNESTDYPNFLLFILYYSY